MWSAHFSTWVKTKILVKLTIDKNQKWNLSWMFSWWNANIFTFRQTCMFWPWCYFEKLYRSGIWNFILTGIDKIFLFSINWSDYMMIIRGHSKTALTNFPPILTTYLPPVNLFTRLSKVDIWGTIYLPPFVNIVFECLLIATCTF